MIPTFVTFKWKPFKGYRSMFGPETVNTLRSMVRRNYRKPHRFVLVTDDATGVDPGIEIVPLWSDFADLISPHGTSFPSCYRRLKIFSAEAKDLIGERIVMMDLDCVVTDDISHIVDRREDFVAWGGTNRNPGGYNCSLVMLTAGTRTQVWNDFDPNVSPQMARQAGCIGSDQGWLTYCLGRDMEARFGQCDGVYSYRNDIAPNGGKLPEGAALVFFHGSVDPWDAEARRLAWVREHYR